MSQIIKAGSDAAHWYTKTGEPMHSVIAKGAGLPRPTTIRDARTLGLLPSVTSITKILDKPALVRWKQEQAVLACLTTSRNEGEDMDAFVERVLNVEKQQEAEADKARTLGTDIHNAIEGMLKNEPVPEHLAPFVAAARWQLEGLGVFQMQRETEIVVIGGEYAGRVDLRCLDKDRHMTIVDFKTCKKLPDKAYPENSLQLAAYAHASHPQFGVKVFNVYISTTEPGQAKTIDHDDPIETYKNGFEPLLRVWKHLNKF